VFALLNVDSIQRRAIDLGIRSKVAEAVAESEFDVIVAYSTDNVQYLSSRWYPILRTRLTRPNLVVWPRRGEPTLVVGTDQVAGYKRDSWVETVRTFEERGRSSVEAVVQALADTLREFGLHDKRIGIEELYVSASFLSRLRALLPEAKFVPCDTFFDRLRMVKTSQEIQLISRAARLADESIRESLETAKAGWTEKQLADEIMTRMLRKGIDMITTILVGAGEGARGFFTPTDHKLSPGEMVRTDLNALLGGYYADTGRTAFVGEAPTAYRQTYAAQLELNRAVIDMIRPGVRSSQVLVFCVDTAREMNLRLLTHPFTGLGHGTGINPAEAPKLNDADDTVILPGMVLNIEPDIFGPQDEVIHMEEMILVEDKENRILTDAADWSELFEIRT
jgi:Xaa-Pro aminopeptidase